MLSLDINFQFMRLTIISSLFLIGSLFVSCSGGEEPVEELKAVGGKQYGGEFKFMSSEKVQSIFSASTQDLYTARVVSQIFEPLLTIDPTSMDVVPNIAESYEVSDDAKVYTFKIRKGVSFHKDDCFGGKSRELNAEDVKFSLDFACSGHKLNKVQHLLVNRIEGAQDYCDKTKSGPVKGGVKGIKVIDDHTVEVTLAKPFIGFEKIVTHLSLGIFPKEALDKYGDKIGEHPVGTGPFSLESNTDEKVVLARNPHYWKKDEFGNRLPFLSKVIVTYTKDKISELKAFRNGEIDLVLEIPVEEINNIFGTLEEAKTNIKHKVDSQKSFSTNYVAMNLQNSEFSNVDVRRAFNMAINRDEIIESWLEGEGWAAKHGFVPAMKNYPTDKVKGHEFNPEKAQELMKKAGYPNGNGFPVIDFYVNTKEGSTIHKMAQAIASEIKQNLNVDLNIVLCTFEEREQAIKDGRAKMWRTGWIADYPDPESFLAMFYGGNISDNQSMVNTFKYKNAQYDALFDQALTETDPEKRMDLFVQCDQIIVDDAVVMPIFTDDHIVLINARVRNFKATPMESVLLTNVFIKEIRKD